MYTDKLWWDLNAPRVSIEQYVAAICADLRLNMSCFLHIVRAMKDVVDKAKQVGRRPLPLIVLCLPISPSWASSGETG